MFHADFKSESLQYPLKKCFLKFVFGALCNMTPEYSGDLLEANQRMVQKKKKKFLFYSGHYL